MQFRLYIAGSLWAGGLLLVVLVVSAGLWGILTIVGDNTAAQVAKGIAVVTSVCWLLNLIALVVLTALGQLALTAEPRDEEPAD